MTPAFPDGFHPFWFWNDRITPQRIRAQVASMHQQGISGFFIHPRQGLGQPYMSARFLELVALAIDEARSRGMAVHLYDEYPYPSGAAGGALTQAEPGLVKTRLQTTQQRTGGGLVRCVLPAGRLLACAAVPLVGQVADWSRMTDLAADVGMVLTRESYYDASPQPYNDRRYFADQPAPVLESELPQGEWELWAVTESVVVDHKYWGHFPDMANPAAVAKFLQLTHERYKSALGERLGQVTSVFVDEVEPEVTRSVLAELHRRLGEDFTQLLLAYVAPSHPRHLAALRAVQDLRLELFVDSFENQVGSWCRSHGLRYSGEKPSVRLRQLAAMDVPGCEPGHTKAGAPRSDLLQADIRGNARATASAAYFYGKEGSLCECFHSLGWGATLQDAKLISESLIALGSRWLVPHAFFYSTRGLRKHDAPPSFLQMPYWPMFGQLSDRIKKIARYLEGTIIDACLGVVEPSGGLPDDEQRACYEELQHQLVQAHCEFLTVDTDILARGVLTKAGWCYRDVTLRALVVPPMRSPEPELHLFLERFEREAGPVFRVRTPADLSTTIDELGRHAWYQPTISCPSGKAQASKVICARRRGASGQWLFLVNTSSQPVELSVSSPSRLLAVDIGAPPPNIRPTARDRNELCLAAFESTLLRIKTEQETPGVPTSEPVVFDFSVGGHWHVVRLSPNLLRLGRWRMTVADGFSGSAIVEPAPVANQLAQSSLAFSPKIAHRFGLGPKITMPEMTLLYETSFQCSGITDLAIVMQEGAIEGKWSVSFDGSAPKGPRDFSPRDDILEDCVAMPVRCARANPGTGPHVHQVVVEVTLSATHEGVRDSIYIAGDFGVFAPRRAQEISRGATNPGQAAGPVEVPVVAAVSSPCTEAQLANWEGSGLPYYAGIVEYGRRLGADEVAASGLRQALLDANEDVVVEVRLPTSCEEAAEIAFGEGVFLPLPWSPRRTRVPARDLLKDPLEVRLRVATALARAFEGRWFDPASHSYRDVELEPPQQVT